MGWLKKVFNKLTSEEQETENKNVHNDLEIEEQEVEETTQSFEYDEVEYVEERATEKKNFKFPMYYDEEQISSNHSQPTMDSEVLNNGEVDNRPLKLRNDVPPVQPIQVEQYTPFSTQSPGRPVLDNGRDYYNPFANSVYKPRVKEQVKELPKAPTKKIPSFEERKRDVKEEVVVEKVVEAPPKKKFVPTEVPSPVYGFKKPSTKTAYDKKVNELLVEERQRRKGTIADQLVQERLEKENRLAGHTTVEKTSADAFNATLMANTTESDEQQTITNMTTVANSATEIVVEKVKYDLADVVTEIEMPEEVRESTEVVVVSEIQAVPETTPEVEVPEIPEVPETTPEVEVPEIPEVPETTPEVEVPEIPAVPETTPEVEVPEIPEVLETTSEVVKASTTRVSKTPINVVMLKSDKEKLKDSLNDTANPLKITFPDWKKNPLRVMQTYGQVQKPIEKATEHKSVDEVYPTSVKQVVLREENEVIQEELIQEELIQEEPIQEELIQEEPIQEEPIQEELIQEELEESKPAHWDSYAQSLALLREPVEEQQDYEWMESQGELLKEVLAEFNVPAEVVQIFQGPTVTQFEITVGHGVKISKIKNLSDNLKLALAARDIRIEAPIPGKRTIGIEIPNAKSRPVRLSEIVGNSTFEQSSNQLEVALGLDLTGQPVTFNLSDMPHGLIAGSTGSGKSVCINSILMSLIMKTSPHDVKLMLIDPKMVELAVYDELPHLVSPVITDVKAATAALKWAVDEMERRYQLFHHMRVRHISRYNEIVEEQRRYSLKMPYLVIVIDELADLMMMAPTEVEESICRIAQKARACGIHLVLATQRPSVDVITGLIKSNIPTRIAFAVSSQIDSRTIIDSQGAERLLGKGDMLYLASGKSDAVRLQGTFVTDEEIEEVTNYIRTLGKPKYSFAPEELMHKVEREEEQDELFEDVCRHVAEEGSVSISSLQRKYRIGYNRAARLVEMMDVQGFVSESRGSKPRDVFITPEKVEEIFS